MSVDDTGEDGHRRVSTVGMLLIAFFWVCGGIYGNESLLEAAPPSYVFIAMLVGSIFYALPLAAISAELATALPYDGGLVAWVEEACGSRLGAHNMYWLWISYIFDAASYPVFAAEYISGRFDLAALTGDTYQGKCIVADLIVACITVVKLGGTDYIIRLSGVFFVLSLLPTTIYMLYGSKDVDPSSWTTSDTSDDAGGLDEAMLLSWVLWLYSGFISIGALAGEIRDPAKTYPTVIGVLVPVVTLYVVWPVAVSISLDSNRTQYGPGHFDDLASDLAGDWLGVAFVFGATASFIGLYNAQVIVCERSLSAVMATFFVDLGYRAKGSQVVQYLVLENGTGVAPIFIIFNAIVASVLVWLPYDALIEFSVLKMCVVTTLFEYAYLWYKFVRPEQERPFCVPGGKVGAIAVTLPVFVINCATFYYGCVSGDVVLGIPDAKILGLVFLIGLGAVVNLAYLGYSRLVGSRASYIVSDGSDDTAQTESLLAAPAQKLPVTYGATGL